MKTKDVLASYWRMPVVLRLFAAASAMIVLFGALMRLIEPETFRTVFDGIWWAIVTAATIGYGDIVPKTVGGKLAAIVLIALGTGIITAYFASISAAAAARETALTSGQLPYAERGHAIIVGWNERAREVLLRLAQRDPSLRFVLIDATVPSHPLPNVPVHFIKGAAHDDAVLEMANIGHARFVLITADPHKAEEEADKDTIVTLLAAKSLNPSVYAIVEILTGRNVQNAFRAGADEVIQTNLLAGTAMAASLRSPGIAGAIERMLGRFGEQTLRLLAPDERQIGQPFAAVQLLLLEQNITLLGVIRGDNGNLAVLPQRPIEKNDRLFVFVP
ncbi:ion transporter [Geobacillus subterraneus]|uniref:Ion transporter n=2 Tax=Geobacillus TaxID=129337 RepID=A0ABM6A8P6_9BACL|nr:MULTISPECIES: potassium channel family protein [Geobacillus]AMX82483.1 ion transporter [Geobacillus subterraneus]KZS24487.1 ion transporter [Geobacillus subterraneus]OXB91514.1 ion transporter [Geobacillus uzenensis]